MYSQLTNKETEVVKEFEVIMTKATDEKHQNKLKIEETKTLIDIARLVNGKPQNNNSTHDVINKDR